MILLNRENHEPEAGKILDLEGNFSEELKSSRTKHLNEGSKNADFGPTAAAFKIAFPDRIKDVVIDETALRKSSDGTRKWGDLTNAVALKILFPEKESGVTSEEVDGQIEEALKLRESNPEFLAQQLADAKILSPKKVGEILKEEDFNAMVGALVQMRKEGHWERFARHASKVKVLFPDKAQDMGVTSEDADKLNQIITGVMEHPKTTHSTDLLAATRILAARDVIVPDEGGLELAM